MAMLDLTNHASSGTFSIRPTRVRIDDQARAIKRAMSGYRTLLRDEMPTMAWGTTISIAKTSGVGAQELTGCGCGCS